MSRSILSVDDIYASYYKKGILRDVSLYVNDGEIVGLIGPNGAGKSTLLKVIAGLLMPRGGHVHFLNQDITKMPPHQRAKLGLSYFIQGGAVFPSLTVKENLELGGIDLSRSELERQADMVMELFPSLSKLNSRRAGLLSGGEKQMLALGMVLLGKPKLLLLDEPSAGLSPALVKEVLDKVRQINRRYEISIVLVEQNIKEALEISERIYLFQNGHIVGEEDPKVLRSGNKIESVFFG